MAHTPGPWHVNAKKPTCVNGPQNAPGLLMDCSQYVEYLEAIDNARLIAAAPDLLGVARAVMLWAKTPGDHGGNPYCLEFVQLADLAVATAMGEKPELYHHAWVDTTPKHMTAQERFAADWKMPLGDVAQLVSLAKRAGKANEHFCNGDPHPSYPNASDKNFNAQRWGNIVDDLTTEIAKLTAPYGFTGVVYTGLGPTLKRGEQFVEVPY